MTPPTRSGASPATTVWGPAFGAFPPCALAFVLVACALPGVSRAAEAPSTTDGEPAPAPSASDGLPDNQAAPAAVPVPMTSEARAHYDQGLRLYGDRDFPAAIREFEAGFALEPRREFLFGEAQAYRLAGDCARAVPLYERFLGSGPSPLQVDATRLALDRCARRPATVAPEPKPAVVAPPNAPPSAPATERAPWWRDRWALGALGAGLAATGVGAGFILASRSAADQANGPGTTHYGDYSRLWDTAERRQTIGIATLAGGGALLAAGALRLLWVRRHPAADKARAEGEHARAGALTAIVTPTPGGAGVLGQVDF